MCFQYFFSSLKDLIIQDSKDDLQRTVRMPVQKIIEGVECLFPVISDRISKDPCKDQGEADRPAAMLCGQFQGSPVSSVKEFWLPVLSVFSSGPDCMDDVPGFQVETRCDYCRARRTMADSVTGFL